MHKENYEDLMLRFAKELHDVGVTENMKKIVEAQYTNRPNLSNPGTEEVVRKFLYRHNGYEIEATQKIKITLKKSN